MFPALDEVFHLASKGAVRVGTALDRECVVFLRDRSPVKVTSQATFVVGDDSLREWLVLRPTFSLCTFFFWHIFL